MTNDSQTSTKPSPTTTLFSILIALAMVTFPIAGAVSTLVTDDPTWVQTQRIAPDPELLGDEDKFGNTVATNGETLFISEPGTETVHVYQRTSLGLEPTQTLTLDGQHNTGFGTAIAVHEDRLIVTALKAEQAHAYQDTPNGWTRTHTLESPESGDGFGRSVDAHDDRIAIGATHTDLPGAIQAGAVHVYTLHEDGTTDHATLTLDEPQQADRTGWDVAIHDDTVATIQNNGAAYIFEHDGNAWHQTTDAIADTGDTRAIALAEDTLAVGHPGETVYFPLHHGAVTIHERTTNGWTHTDTLRAHDANTHENLDAFGAALDLANDGTHLAVGAPHEDPTPGIEPLPTQRDNLICRNAPTLETCDAQGAAYLFQATQNGWTQTAKVTPLDQGYGFPTADSTRALSGTDVALSPTLDHVAVGAPLAETMPPTDAGAAYLFEPATEVTSK